jgi:hypothetical protein
MAWSGFKFLVVFADKAFQKFCGNSAKKKCLTQCLNGYILGLSEIEKDLMLF